MHRVAYLTRVRGVDCARAIAGAVDLTAARAADVERAAVSAVATGTETTNPVPKLTARRILMDRRPINRILAWIAMFTLVLRIEVALLHFDIAHRAMARFGPAGAIQHVAAEI
jgi:hypothetical protein